ncbi:UNVERIFIED_CONTAM: hypothetical protein K2H54_018713 [Gekko kuhli]
MDFWARPVEPWRKIMDLLEKVKILLDDLDQNPKEKVSASWEEIWDTYENLEARNVDFCERNTDFWKKIGDHLERVKKICQKKQGPKRDALGGLEKERKEELDVKFCGASRGSSGNCDQMENRKKMLIEALNNVDPKSRTCSEAKQVSRPHMTPFPPSLHKQLLQKSLKEEKRALQAEIKKFWGKCRALRVEIKAFQEDNETKTLWEDICNYKQRSKGFLEEINNYLEGWGLFMMEINHFQRKKLEVLEKVSNVQNKIGAFQEKIKAMVEEIISFEVRKESLQTAVKAFQVKNQLSWKTNKAMQEKNKSLQEKMEALGEKNETYWKECKAFWKKDKVFWEEGMAISRDMIVLCEEYIALADLHKEMAGMRNVIKVPCDAICSICKDISGFLEKELLDIKGGTVGNGAGGDHDAPSGELKMCG